MRQACLLFSLVSVLFLCQTADVFPQSPPAKQAVPTDADQEQALALVREVYKDEHVRAKTADQKAALAKKLLGKAEESKADPVSYFVLLRVARDVAAQAGAIDVAFQSVDQMDSRFALDAIQAKRDVLLKASSSASETKRHEVVAQFALGLVETLVTADKFDEAVQAVKFAVSEAKAARSGSILKQATARETEVEQLAAAYAEVAAALGTLSQSADDPAANLAAGKYYCLSRGAWEKGLPMLALGSDATMKALATADLSGPTESADQVKLGDGWWGLSEQADDSAKTHLQQRAAYWYRRALPQTAGLVKDKLTKRLGNVPEAGGSQETGPSVVAVWNRSGEGGPLSPFKLYSNGMIDKPAGPSTWSLRGRQLVLRWAASESTPRGATDTVLITPDGRTFTGTNNAGATVRGTLASGGVLDSPRTSHTNVPKGWIVIFCSSDPSIWNTNTSRGKTDFARPLASVPADIQYLRMRLDATQTVIVPMTWDRLGRQSVEAGWGWNGSNEFKWGTYHLGLYDPASKMKAVTGEVYLGTKDACCGWGFGHVQAANAGQGYAWARKTIGATVMEIAVTCEPLSPQEQKQLAR